MRAEKQAGNRSNFKVVAYSGRKKIHQYGIARMNEQIGQMKPGGVKTPERVVYKIRQGNKRAVAEFSGNFEIILVEKCREIPPIPYEWVVRDNPEIVKHELMLKGVQVRKE